MKSVINGRITVGYPGQDIEYNSYEVTDFGTNMNIWGNSWKKIEYDYQVTPQTVLDFSFRSTHQEPEYSGIGFVFHPSDEPNDYVFDEFFYKVYGTHSYGFTGAYDTYSGVSYQRFIIPVGQRFSGRISHIVLVSDEDNHVGQFVSFKNVSLRN